MKIKCPYCEEIEKGFLEFNNLNLGNRILYETKNFIVFPSIGQIVEGYLLITPKKHYLSIANIPEELFDELEFVKRKVEEILIKTYKTPIFFEHGSVSEKQKVGCCITHAHIHAVPTNVSISNFLSENFNTNKINSYNELPRKKAYLLLEEKNERFIYSIKEFIPSQYLRKIIANKLNCAEKGDWRAYPGISELKKTIEKLKPFFINKQKYLKIK
jgi:diadenosine tetraphosphate (Ap4A) HIT family hydrolase